MKLVTFETNNTDQNSNDQTQIKVSKKRKPGAGRKPIYTSRSVSFSTSIPKEAVDELREVVNTLKAKYRK